MINRYKQSLRSLPVRLLANQPPAPLTWLDDWQSDLYGQVTDPEHRSAQDLAFWWELFDEPALNR
jgi:hypothetical protein